MDLGGRWTHDRELGRGRALCEILLRPARCEADPIMPQASTSRFSCSPRLGKLKRARPCIAYIRRHWASHAHHQSTLRRALHGRSQRGMHGIVRQEKRSVESTGIGGEHTPAALWHGSLRCTPSSSADCLRSRTQGREHRRRQRALGTQGRRRPSLPARRAPTPRPDAMDRGVAAT